MKEIGTKARPNINKKQLHRTSDENCGAVARCDKKSRKERPPFPNSKEREKKKKTKRSALYLHLLSYATKDLLCSGAPPKALKLSNP